LVAGVAELAVVPGNVAIHIAARCGGMHSGFIVSGFISDELPPSDSDDFSSDGMVVCFVTYVK
jgi:hypothetical protein